MPRSLNTLLDPTGWRILVELQRNGRLSLSELARRISLSAPAAHERVRRLEEAGVIAGYHAEVDASHLGLPILAFIRINTPTRAYPRFLAVVEAMPEICECHHVAGVDSFILKTRVSTNAHLEEVLRRLSPFGETTTSIVLSSPVPRRAIQPPLA